MADDKTARIRGLNDAFRTTLSGDNVYITDGVSSVALPLWQRRSGQFSQVRS